MTGSTDHASPDPRELLLSAPMSGFQISAVLACASLAMMDGFDVVAITFAVPAIVKDWGISKAAAGLVLSAGLFGMAFGALLLAPFADVFGRRRVLLAAISLVLLGTLWTAVATQFAELLASRLLSGLGLGTLISVNYILASEYANARRRDFVVGMVVTCYGLGAALGGMISAWLLGSFGWRAIFLLGAGLGMVILVLAWRILHEPLAFIMARPADDGLARANTFLRRCGHREVAALPPVPPATNPVTALLKGKAGHETAILTVIFFCFMIPQYYLQTWAPTLVTDLGFSPSDAAFVTSFFSVGGVTAGVVISLTSGRIDIKVLNYLLMSGSLVMTVVFALLPASTAMLAAGAAITGFFIQGGLVAFYVVVQRTFPPHVRASGTGFVLGMGRLGSTLPPLMAGTLFDAGAGRMSVTVMMAAPLLLCIGLLLPFRVRPPNLA